MDNQLEIELNPTEILKKEFKSKMRGYDPEEVDGYLDLVIKDYQTYQENIDRLTADNTRLFNKVEELNRQLSASDSVKEVKPQQASAATNYDILKRLSNLERHVFGAKLNDQNGATQTRVQNHSQFD
ncbi:cell division regulator GpsB [Latilactobacillus sakei subsp. sakei]|uniref:cell division regulator GpsB n=1 Tax=Latilactobacillus sakei TaxID=1599 RepID=UPI00286330DB|nr:cell division regulator GpsB [Latilactobacillus sakei]MDR7923541.1 cell division regulator GpsB [Latilactobacillus sakei subsp. sakei]